MSSLRDPLTDERFDELVAQLRATRPRASEELRVRVRTLPAPAPRRPLLPRLVPVLAAAALLAAAVGGIAVLGRTGGEAVSGSAGEEEAAQSLESAAPVQGDAVAPGGGESLEPAPGRLQDYRVDLTVRVGDVDELSQATASAMRTAQTLGGYVVSASYDTPRSGKGDSRLVLRVPLGRVQEAIARLSSLGTIVAQRIQLQDLQQAADQQSEAIARLRARIAALERQLAAPGLPEEERVVLRSRLEAARDELARALEAREATVRAGSFAEVTLALTTREGPAAPPRESVVGDAVGALGTVWTWALAALILAGPFLALAAAALVVVRRLRRRSDERLLERA